MSKDLINNLVAVYGSLREGLGNHRCLGIPNEDHVRQEDGIISEGFRMVSLGGFPGLLQTTDPTDIVVEVYEVKTPGAARRLDALEGYPSFYDRKIVTLQDGREAWVYFLDNKYDNHPRVVGGDWVKYKIN